MRKGISCPARNGCHGQSGFSLVEALIALALLVTVMGAVFGILNPGAIAAQTQPETIDLQQRARVAMDALQRDLHMAGAGLRAGPAPGPLSHFFAAVVPRRMGLQGSDVYNVARADVITVHRLSAGFVQTTLRDPMASGASSLSVNEPGHCPSRNGACGLAPDTTVVVFDQAGQSDWFTIGQLLSPLATVLPHQSSSAAAYPPGAYVAQAEADTYWHDPVTRQLRHYDGYQTDVPVVDNVVGLSFEYLGDPDPPVRPKPALGTANCLYDASGNVLPGLSRLSAQGGSLAELPLPILNDGPWCGAGDTRFDADLLRIRAVRVRIRLQAGQAAHRSTGTEYAVPGSSRSAQRSVPDFSAAFVVAPRNLNLGR